MAKTNRSELSLILEAAGDRHISTHASIVPDCVSISTDRDATHPSGYPTIRKGDLLFMRAEERGQNAIIYRLDLAEPAADEAGEAVRVRVTSDAGLDEVVTSWLVRVRTADGQDVRLADLMAWLAINDAEDAGSAQELDRIMALAYGEAAREKRPLVMRTGKVFTEAMHATTKRGVYVHEDGGEFLMAGRLMVRTTGSGRLAATVGMNKTLMYLNHLATISGYGYEEGRSCIVHTTIDELLERRGLDPTRKNKDRVRSDLQALARWAWEFEDVNTKAWVRVPLAGGVKIARGGAVTFSLTPEFMREIINRRAGLLPADPALMRTDDKRNPNAFTIGYKLMTHSYQNAGETNQNTLSVSRLLDYVETIPKAEDVASRHHTRRIVEPMERDLTALVDLGMLDWWDYCHVKGEPLTDEEQAARFDEDGNERALPYEIAIRANIQWQLSNAYEEEIAKTIEARERHRKEAAEAKTKRRRRAGRAKG